MWILLLKFNDVDDVGVKVEVSSHVRFNAECRAGVTQMNGSQLELNNLDLDYLSRIDTSNNECRRRNRNFSFAAVPILALSFNLFRI